MRVSVPADCNGRGNGHRFLDDELLAPLTEAVVATPAESARGELEESLASGAAMLSVVIPLLNEVDSLEDLYARLRAALCSFAPNYEIIFVDDGSRDGSFDKLEQVWQRDPRVTVIRFRKNFGKAAALSAGFDRVRGDVIAMMDADLQDQPEELPKLIAKLDDGYDLVTGWKKRRHDPLTKTLPSRLFNKTVARYFKLDIHDFNCGLKAMRAVVAQDIRLYGEFHRFIPVLAANKGYRVTECSIIHCPRVHGVSKYGAKRLITGMYDFLTSILLTKFIQKPLHLFGTVGLITILFGVLCGIYTIIEMALGHGHRMYLALTPILLLGGVQLFCTGLIAELVTHTAYHHTPRYVTSEVLKPRG